jgi:hypothetical protein
MPLLRAWSIAITLVVIIIGLSTGIDRDQESRQWAKTVSTSLSR